MFSLIYCDVCGSYRVPTYGSAKYCFTKIFLMAKKSEVRSILSFFLNSPILIPYFHSNVKSDHGGEFMGLKEFFHRHGINHQTTIPFQFLFHVNLHVSF